MAKPSKKAAYLEAQAALEWHKKNLHAHELLWEDKWRAAHDPFVAVKQWTSAAFRAKRAKVIGPWLQAKELVEKLRPKTGG